MQTDPLGRGKEKTCRCSQENWFEKLSDGNKNVNDTANEAVINF